MPDLGLHKTLSRVSVDRRGTHRPLPLPAERLTTHPLLTRQHQGLRLRTQWWEFQNLGHTDVSDQVQWITKQTKRHEHENGARRDEGGVCVTGVRDIEDGGDGVHIMHHTDTWSYQAPNWTNLKVGLGLKLGVTASKTFVCSSQDAELYFYGTYWLSVLTHASDLHLQRLLLESRLSHFNYWLGVCYTTKSSL